MNLQINIEMYSNLNNQNTSNNSLQFGNNTLLRGNNDQSQQSFIKQIYSYIVECQTDKYLYGAINILNTQCNHFLSSMDELAKMSEIMVYDEQFNKEIRERCLKLKKQNETLMMELFNFRENISKVVSYSLEKDIDKANQLANVQERIRKTKMDISGKFEKLRRMRASSKSKESSNIRAGKRKASPLKVMNIALIQLKDASDIVSREMIKQREEIKTLIKLLYEESV